MKTITIKFNESELKNLEAVSQFYGLKKGTLIKFLINKETTKEEIKQNISEREKTKIWVA